MLFLSKIDELKSLKIWETDKLYEKIINLESVSKFLKLLRQKSDKPSHSYDKKQYYLSLCVEWKEIAIRSKKHGETSKEHYEKTI